MARVTHVKKAQRRYVHVPVLDGAGLPKLIPVMHRNGTQKVTKGGKPVTMRVTVPDRDQPKPNYRCEKCGGEIKVGHPYKHVSPRSGPFGGRKRVRCQQCPSWRPSELTGSEALRTLYAAQEAAEDALNNWDRDDPEGLKEILTALADGVREAGEIYNESADNMEDGFGHETSISEELREKGEHLDGQADEIESAADDIEDWDEEEPRAEAEADALADCLIDFEIDGDPDLEEAQDHEDWDDEVYEEKVLEFIDATREAWADEQIARVEEAISEAEAL